MGERNKIRGQCITLSVISKIYRTYKCLVELDSVKCSVKREMPDVLVERNLFCFPYG